MISVLVVDDEPPARRRIRSLLADQADLEVVGECGNGREAITAIRELHPDLVFLDVQMPEVSGFDVIEAIGPAAMPVVVFATAYDEFALRAFDAHALDYLLKPFEQERFERALERVRHQLRRVRDEGEDERLRALVRALRGEATRLERLPVRVGPRTRLIALDDVDYLEARSNYVRLHVGERSYLVRDTLSGLEARLDRGRFLRIHRSLVVNMVRVQEVESLFAGEYVLHLRGGVRITSGRTYRRALETAFGLRA
ncbi:MAG TPA: response regulator [Gemmatimonadales bacterium]|nr:response regulator [Gemmatimonadales bacterium]